MNRRNLLMFTHIYYEISEGCNAKCFWCQTGYANRKNQYKNKFVDLDMFKKDVAYMKDNRFISPETVFGVYNWGEPMLHPQFKEIIGILKDQNILTSISTNASRFIGFEGVESLSHISQITFSVPGFSQNSYDHVHGFNFENIKRNIELTCNNYLASGFKGNFVMAYHIYQFNMKELKNAIAFANSHNMIICPSFAFINDYERQKQYLESTLDSESMYRATKELFLYYVEDMIKSRPVNYSCDQFNRLNINCDGEVITCCADSTKFKRIVDIQPEDVNEWRCNSEVCKSCDSRGQNYYNAEFTTPKELLII